MMDKERTVQSNCVFVRKEGRKVIKRRKEGYKRKEGRKVINGRQVIKGRKEGYERKEGTKIMK
jgi:ribosomal protein L34